MSAIEIQSEAFEQAALKSERVRVIGLLGALAALVAIAAVRALVFGAPGEQRLLVSIIGLAVGMTVCFVSWLMPTRSVRSMKG